MGKKLDELLADVLDEVSSDEQELGVTKAEGLIGRLMKVLYSHDEYGFFVEAELQDDEDTTTYTVRRVD